MTTVSAKTLTLWSKKISKVSMGGIVNFNGEQNPIAAGKYLVFNAFSPGMIIVANRQNGQVIWKRKLNYLSGVCPQFYKGYIYSGTAQEIHCFELNTGKIKWTFCPYGLEGETIYSTPVFNEGKMYLGDRSGFLYCLNPITGHIVWKTQTGSGENNQVNGSPLIKGKIIYVTNNCRKLIALDKRTGKILWSLKTPAASIYRPILNGNRLILNNGELIETISLKVRKAIPKERIRFNKINSSIFVNPSHIFAVQNEKLPEKVGDYHLSNTFLAKYKNGKLIQKIKIDEYVFCVAEIGPKGYLCLVGYNSLDFYSLKKGMVTDRISLLKTKAAMPSTPFFKDNKLYLFNMDGYLQCLKMPKLGKS